MKDFAITRKMSDNIKRRNMFMAMQVNGNYEHSRTDYAERVKEKQAAERAEKVREAEKAAEEKKSGRLSEPQDEYISSERSGKKPTGLYRVSQDENGSRKIFFDDPKAGHVDGKGECSGEGEDGKGPKAGGNSQGKPAEKCVTNTDKVDREIKKLKEEKKLAQAENELSRKDNDTYRRQNASVMPINNY